MLTKPTIYLLCWIFLAILSLELYSLVPYSDEHKSFYPLYPKQKVTLQVWVDYASIRLGVLIFLYQLSLVVPRYRYELRQFFWLFSGYCVDYFLFYNLPIDGTNISYTMFMIAAMAGTIFSTIRSEQKEMQL